MSDKERITRPKPERTRPNRNWSTLFGPSGPTAAELPGNALQDVVSRSVDLGYRVVDEYIRRGQKAAQRINDRSYDAGALTGEFQEITVRMAQYASDFAAIWLDFLQLAAANAASRPGAPSDGKRAAAAAETASAAAPAANETIRQAPETADHTRVKIEISASRATEVSLDLRPHATARPLRVHALRAMDPDKPRLIDVAFHGGSDGDPASLRIRVPDDQPPDVYNGLIIDEETNRPVGTLSVRIAAE